MSTTARTAPPTNAANPKEITITLQDAFVYVALPNVQVPSTITADTEWHRFCVRHDAKAVARFNQYRFLTKATQYHQPVSLATIQQCLTNLFPSHTQTIHKAQGKFATHVVNFGPTTPVTPPPPQAPQPPAVPAAQQATTTSDTTQIASALAQQIAARLTDKLNALENRLTQNEQADTQNERIDNQQDSAILETNASLNQLSVRLDKLADRINNLVPQVNNYHVTFANNQTHTSTVGRTHKQFNDLFRVIRALYGKDANIMLIGMPGTGKSYVAQQIAEMLHLTFYAESAIKSDYRLVGFMDAQGRIVSTNFRRWWENGGIYCAEEQDAWDNSAVIAIQPMLASGYANFPDVTNVPRHPDCIFIAGANTYGSGPDAQFVGRTKLDDAYLDRFLPFPWLVDEELELSFANNKAWAKCVQDTRHLIDANRTARAGQQNTFLVSPRATLRGDKLLSDGFTAQQTVDLVFGRYSHLDSWRTFAGPSQDFVRNNTNTNTNNTNNQAGN